MRNLQRRVADLARLLLEDRADQLLLRRQLGLALRRHLADEQVAGPTSAPMRTMPLVEVGERLLRAVRMSRVISSSPSFVGGRRSRTRGCGWTRARPPSRAAQDHDRVLEVVALERHERDEPVRAERSSPWSVDDPSARTAPALTLSPSLTIGFWWISVPWFERMNFVRS